MTRYKLSNRPISVILHGPYDQYHTGESREKLRNAPVDCCNILFFGVIRPFKGLEDLVMAFNRIPEDQIDDYWLTIAGEPWEGWSLPFELIEQSRYRERITLIREYVADSDIPGIFAGADVVALPYHRSSASGPLHIAMSWGLPIITTEVGGLPEAVTGYEGAILVPPAKPEAILEAIPRARDMQGSKYASHHSWNNTVNAYSALFEDIGIL